jgi:hypothetical protein
MNDSPANEGITNPQDPQAHDQLAADLFSLELALLDPAVRRDRARVESLLADDFQEFGASGRIWSRDQILDMIESENPRPIAAHEFACHPIADGVTLITYRAVSTPPETGEPIHTLRSSLWTCVQGQWKIRFHQGTRELGTRVTAA